MHILALHPNPFKEMLLPIMHENLAQITRTWIAASLITGQINEEPLHDLYLITEYQDNRPSHIGQSYPTDIIKWNETDSFTQVTSNESHKSTISYNDINLLTKEIFPHENNTNANKGYKATTTATQPTDEALTSPIGPYIAESQEDITCSSPTTGKKQQKITTWTTNKMSTDTITKLNNIEPYGTPLSPMDSTKSLRIIVQNTQYALQISNDYSERMQIIDSLQELDASIFIAISPNINFCNPSHKAQFKHPFNRAFKQVHLSAVSSDVGNQR